MRPSHFLKGAVTAVALLGIPLASSLVPQRPGLAQQPSQPPMTLAESPMNVSETQIEQFAAAYADIQAIQQQVQPEIIAAVEAAGLTVEEFEAMMVAQQSPETEAPVPPESSQEFTAAYERVTELQAAARTDMQAAIEKEGLAVEEFEQILAMAQQNPVLAERINDRLAEE